MKNKKIPIILIISVLLPAITLLSSDSTRIVSATPMDWNYPEPNGRFWDFDNNTIIGWHVKSNTGDTDLIYNISSMKYSNNTITGAETNFTYTVVLKQAYFNVTTMSVQEYTDLSAHPIVNASIINYTWNYGLGFPGIILPYDVSGGQSNAIIAIPFIPKNSTNEIDIYWVAQRAHWLYNMWMGPGASGSKLVVTNKSISISNSTIGSYANMTYYSDGTLESADLYIYFTGVWHNISYTRIFDFNPINDTNWLVSGGETLYYGYNKDEVKLDILNITVRDYGIVIVEEIWANASFWVPGTQSWYGVGTLIVGVANDYSPMVLLGGMNAVPFIIPIGSTISELALAWEGVGELTGDFNLVSFGADWVQIRNTTNEAYIYYQYLPNGTLKYAHGQGLDYLFGENYTVLYLKNYTVLASGMHSFSVSPLGTADFQVSISIALDATVQVFFSGFINNPFENHSLSNSLLFIDIMLNDTASLDTSLLGALNISVQIDPMQYENIAAWWFNTSAAGGNGAWESVTLSSLGNGLYMISINHTSIFAFTGTLVIPEEEPPGGNGTPPGGIPGYDAFYIIFSLFIGMGIIILLKKKKF